MSAYGLLNLLNECGKREKCKVCQAFYPFFSKYLIIAIIQEHNRLIVFII